MKTVFLGLVIFCFCPYLARADTPFPSNCTISPVPDISGWEVVSKSRTEFRLSGTAMAYLGLDIEYAEYRDPNSSEFVRVISRHIPLIPEQKRINERVIFDAATALYARKEEQDRLNQLDENTDPILYIRWRTKTNLRTGKDERDRDVDLWLLKPSGECFVAKNEKVGVQFLTENVSNGKPHNVFVGVKYQVGDVYHILKVDRRDVLLLTNGRER